jgi:Flp pilus assembly protein TadG
MKVRRCRGDSGAATTELVIITPAFFGLVLFIVHVGLWLHAVHVASTAAQEAAAVARSHGGTEAAAEARGRDFLSSTSMRLWQQAPAVDVTYINDANGVQEARAEVRGTVQGVFPELNLRVVEVSQGPVERFRAPGEEQNAG